jgi:KGK domain
MLIADSLLKTDGHGWQKGRVRISLEFIPDEEKQEQEIL